MKSLSLQTPTCGLGSDRQQLWPVSLPCGLYEAKAATRERMSARFHFVFIWLLHVGFIC